MTTGVITHLAHFSVHATQDSAPLWEPNANVCSLKPLNTYILILYQLLIYMYILIQNYCSLQPLTPVRSSVVEALALLRTRSRNATVIQVTEKMLVT